MGTGSDDAAMSDGIQHQHMFDNGFVMICQVINNDEPMTLPSRDVLGGVWGWWVCTVWFFALPRTRPSDRTTRLRDLSSLPTPPNPVPRRQTEPEPLFGP